MVQENQTQTAHSPLQVIIHHHCTHCFLVLWQMLTFHPEYRITVDEALEHPYLEELHSQVQI